MEQIEKDFDPALDASPLNELKGIILRRIAELEFPESPVKAILSEAPARTETPLDPTRTPA
jgi:hypothetical protein